MRDRPRRSKRNPLAYIRLIPEVADYARRHGYAVTVHGSLQRDLDLVAIPWTESACSPRELVEGLALHLGWFIGAHGIAHPAKKPHGRRGWVLVPKTPPGSLAVNYHKRACYIDLSVMPRRRT